MSHGNISRWLSEPAAAELELFEHCSELQTACRVVTQLLLDTVDKWSPPPEPFTICAKSFLSSVADIQELDRTVELLNKIVKLFYRLHPRLARLAPRDDLAAAKRDAVGDNLCGERFVLLAALRDLLETLLACCLRRDDMRKLIEISFSLVSSYNQLLGLSYRSFTGRFNVCSNVCPNVVDLTNKFTITRVVQLLARSRAEINCHRLIDCLVQIYRPHHTLSDDSSTESLEIYHALTKHITPPPSSAPTTQTKSACIEKKRTKMKSMKSAKASQRKKQQNVEAVSSADSTVPYISLNNQEFECGNSEMLNGMLQSEEIYIEVLLDTAVNMAPGMLGAGGVKKSSTGEVRIQKKAAEKLTRHYQSALWGEVGGHLEHVVLWWSSSPLAVRAPSASQNLREWLTTFNCNNTPGLVLGALRVLGDALGCHVGLASWDKLFGATLVTNLKATTTKLGPDVCVNVTECTESGANFALVLQELVGLSNQCEVTGDYILGAPVDELPLVEQIPILHRLDHSIHTCRLWTLAETRRLANAWQLDDFFRIAHNDIEACMEQLVNLRFADHSTALSEGNVGVHEQVCGRMREKLVSEIKVNVKKLKEAPDEIAGVLAAVCGTTSLAHLTIVFPAAAAWRAVVGPRRDHSQYVHTFLDKVLLPVVQATRDTAVLNMTLRIACESWLHHIYVAKIKFSKDAAIQLLADFNEVRNWLKECPLMTDNVKKQVLDNEVLRRCEGVGRLLLHAPGDRIAMQDSTVSTHKPGRDDDTEVTSQLMPAEMYVPNQQQWLTLRAKRLRVPHFCFMLCLCC